MLQRLLDNPVALIGVIRAVALSALTFAPTLFTSDQMDGVLYALALALPVISLVFTTASTSASATAVQTALETPAPGGKVAPLG